LHQLGSEFDTRNFRKLLVQVSYNTVPYDFVWSHAVYGHISACYAVCSAAYSTLNNRSSNGGISCLVECQ